MVSPVFPNSQTVLSVHASFLRNALFLHRERKYVLFNISASSVRTWPALPRRQSRKLASSDKISGSFSSAYIGCHRIARLVGSYSSMSGSEA